MRVIIPDTRYCPLAVGCLVKLPGGRNEEIVQASSTLFGI
jgi:hypothetical protein